MGNSFLHWIGGSHIRTDRDRLCEEFLEKVQAQLELIRTALEGPLQRRPLRSGMLWPT